MRLHSINDKLLAILESHGEQAWLNALRKSQVQAKVIPDDKLEAYGYDTHSEPYPVIITPYNGKDAVTLGSLDEDILKTIIARVQLIVNTQASSDADKKLLNKSISYWFYQIAKGNMPLQKLYEDSQRLINTIINFNKHSKKGQWKESKNLYDYDDWRTLEKLIVKFKSEIIKYEKDSSSYTQIIFTKSYDISNKNINLVNSLLYGDEAKVVEPIINTYWLRRVTSVETAYKYGRGTQWCTASDPLKYFRDYRGEDYRQYHPGLHYLRSGLFIIEAKRAKYGGGDELRKPILQIHCGSNPEIKNVDDLDIGGVKKNLCQFFIDCLPSIKKLMESPESDVMRPIPFSVATYRNKEMEEFGNNLEVVPDMSDQAIYKNLYSTLEGFIKEYKNRSRKS